MPIMYILYSHTWSPIINHRFWDGPFLVFSVPTFSNLAPIHSTGWLSWIKFSQQSMSLTDAFFPLDKHHFKGCPLFPCRNHSLSTSNLVSPIRWEEMVRDTLRPVNALCIPFIYIAESKKTQYSEHGDTKNSFLLSGDIVNLLSFSHEFSVSVIRE